MEVCGTNRWWMKSQCTIPYAGFCLALGGDPPAKESLAPRYPQNWLRVLPSILHFTIMRPVAPDAVGSEILSQLRSRDPYDQYFAVMSICDLERTELLPAVVPLLQSQCTDLRYVAIQTIGDHGKSNQSYYGPLLLPFLANSDAEMRLYAAEALAAIDYQDSIPEIERMLEAEVDEEAREFTERALRYLKRENTPEDDLPVFRLMSVDLSRSGAADAPVPATVH